MINQEDKKFLKINLKDIYPDIWPSQTFMILLIIAALIVLPSQVLFEILINSIRKN